MSEGMWFSFGGDRVQGALIDAFAWCEGCYLVGDAPAEGDSDEFWSLVEQHASRLRAVVLRPVETAEGKVLLALQASGALRQVADGSARAGNFVWFERGSELRFFAAPDAFRADTMTGKGLWFAWAGPKSAQPEGLPSCLEALLAESAPADLEAIEGSPASVQPVTYSRPIPSVREVLGIRSTKDFFELEPPDQDLALWSALIGEGAVDLEQAIRLCATRLRAQGVLEYQALRQDGRVYSAIEERLLAARRATELFDRPRNGFVRAIQANLDDLTAEQWLDCLMGALAEGLRVDRDQAVRLGFEQAQVVYGVNAQRLRGGGRADQALRSAINRSIRARYLVRDGAAYLIRIAGKAEPTLRGALDSERVVELAAMRSAAEPEPRQPEESPRTLPALAVPVPPPIEAEAVASGVLEPESSAPRPPPAVLESPLAKLNLPTRLLNWADRRGVETLADFLRHSPDAFENERNIGRRTVRETREFIEATLGCSWEDAHANATGDAGASVRPRDSEEVDATTEALTAGGGSGWAQLAKSLTDEQRGIALVDVSLPTRMRNFVRSEKLDLLGDLFQLTYANLAARDNLGRRSLNDTLDAVRDYLSERSSPPVHTTFLQAWHAQLSALEPTPRLIVTRRAGMHGTRETLEEIGAMLGLTRERVRQIEARVLERLRERSRWRRLVETKVSEAFGTGRAVPLGLLAQDAWWSGIDRQELLLDYVVRRIFEDELFLLEAPSGKRYLTKFAPDEFAEHLDSAKSRASKLEYPVEASAIREILHSEVDLLDPILFSEFESAVGEMLHLDPEHPDVVLGYGRYRDDEIMAFLSGQEQPVPIAVIEERFGRGRFPSEVLYFKRGLVGLKRHFPDFDGWMERLVPLVLESMAARPAGRQWLVPELHDMLRERGLVPDWLGHWHLASLLRLSGKVEYLGRLRVASVDGPREDRLQYEALLQRLLEEAGGPIDFDELLARARRQTDIGEAAASMRTLAAPFVRLDKSRVGLLDRDVPGGPEAVAAAIELVIRTLNDSQRGLTPYQATLLVRDISAVHATWTKQLVTSLLRNEPSLRIDRSKNIGLDEWDDVRCPTQPEFLRREVHAAGGELAISELSARFQKTFGRSPERAQLAVLASEVELSLAGDKVVRSASEADEAPPSAVGINLTGVPAELRELFEDLTRQPLSDPLGLRAEVAEHLTAIEVEHSVNEFVDLEGARILANQANLLLDRWSSLAPSEKRIAHAAVRYFVSWHDLEHDLDIGGLDDDKQIMNAVFTHLGIRDQADGALAS